MTDLRPTIVPKSDQVNADDFIGGPRTITVTKVLLTESADQPVSIRFEGDNGKPFRPCKSMRRVLVQAWGPDGAAYIGRSMTLYRDENVQFGNAPVGGIRISHLSHIDKPLMLSLTEKRGQRKPFPIKPLKSEDTKRLSVDDVAADEAAREGMNAYHAFVRSLPKQLQGAYVATDDHKRRKQIASDVDDEAMLRNGHPSEPLKLIAQAQSVSALMELWTGLPSEITDDDAVFAAYEAKRDELSAQAAE